ncbi:MAG: PhnD/SsuA/transferrin family substrate-binding protein, partial [Cyanobacteriota bacterium]
MGSALAVLALSLPAVAQALPPPATCVGDPLGRRWRVGVVPQRPASQTAASWTPVLQEVGQRSGQCLTLVVPATIPAFEQLLRSGNLDFAYLNPYHQLLAHRWQGFVPLVRDR